MLTAAESTICITILKAFIFISYKRSHTQVRCNIPQHLHVSISWLLSCENAN